MKSWTWYLEADLHGGVSRRYFRIGKSTFLFGKRPSGGCAGGDEFGRLHGTSRTQKGMWPLCLGRRPDARSKFTDCRLTDNRS